MWLSRHQDLANILTDFYRSKMDSPEFDTDDFWSKPLRVKYKIWEEKYWHWHVRCVLYYVHELELR